ncbi:uncharacterized protein LOC143354376 isoform X2 [Halictus rubicundus]|uniref:uncharacterized protein LOC143354376 isoform X2 n=1 Tax=Halictus rubicundus TaxID=77578 RepID=UPI00403649A8
MSNVWNKNLYRQEQEAFVSNHGGTTAREVVHAIMPNICSILLTTTTLGLLRNLVHRNVKVMIEFVLLVIPSILCCTVLSEYIITVCCAMLSISIINVLVLGLNPNSSGSSSRPSQARKPFITNFRALTNIITSICILAIDFRIFPLAPEAKAFAPKQRMGFVCTLSKNIKQSAKSCIPLLILGFGRSVAIELIGYQKHVTEYGIHWNFFITLAFVKLFTSSITSTISSKYYLLSGIWILSMHEYILSTKGLKEWVLSNKPRDDFVSANREGMVSVPGYVGLYLIGVAVGTLIHSTYYISYVQSSTQYTHKTINMKLFGYSLDASYNESMILCIKLSLIAAQTCAATLFCDSYFKVSRRLANAGYCMWILTLGVMFLTLLLLIEIITDILIRAMTHPDVTERKTKTHKADLRNKRERVPEQSEKNVITIEILEAVNYNGLFFFLLANLMTGGVNMLVPTLHVSQSRALQILIAYMALNILSVLFLYRKQIQIKL